MPVDCLKYIFCVSIALYDIKNNNLNLDQKKGQVKIFKEVFFLLA